MHMTDKSDKIGSFFRPRSVAVIGASNTPGKRGHHIISNLKEMGFGGEIYPINPRYQDVLGFKCYPRIAELPVSPELVAICLPSSEVPDSIEQCGRKGIRAAAVVSADFADSGPEGRKRQEDMLAAAERYGMAIMGPAGLGVLNRFDRVQYWMNRPPGLEYRDDKHPSSGVSCFIQSGALALSAAVDALERGIVFDYQVSTGIQASLDISDYIDWLIHDTRVDTRVIGLVIEGIGKPEKFRRIAEEACCRGIAIVALRSGRNEASREYIASHTGAMVGSAAVFEQVFRQVGVIEVRDLNEWMEQIALMAQPRRPRGNRWVMIGSSGAGNAIISDLSADIGLPIPPVPQHTVSAMNRIAEKGVLNPVDAGGYYDAKDRYLTAFQSAMEDPEVDVVIGSLTSFPEPEQRTDQLFEAAMKALSTSDKPLLLCNFSSGPVGKYACNRMRAAGLFPMKGVRESLLALQRWLWWHERHRALASGRKETSSAAQVTLPSLPIPTAAGNVSPADARWLLSAVGLKLAEVRPADSAEEAVAAAEQMGWPVVMKVDHADLLHKSEVGAVAVGLASQEQVAETYRRMAENVVTKTGLRGAEIVVQKQIPQGVEILLSARNDPVFGPYIVAASGGIFTELLKDYAVRPVPVSREAAREMLESLRGFALLNGFRGGAKYDIASLCDAITQLSALAAQLGPRLQTLELNPLMVLPDQNGAWVVDITLSLLPEN